MSYILNSGAGGSGGGGITTINGDVGSVTGDPITLTGGVSGAIFTGSGSTLTQSFDFLALPSTTATDGQITVGGNRFIHAMGFSNAFVGFNSGNFTLTGTSNSSLGNETLNDITSGTNNVAIGNLASDALTSANNTVSLGAGALGALQGGNYNTALGSLALDSVVSGTNNIGIGLSGGGALTGADSDNIIIGNTGTIGDNGKIIIGTNATHTSAYVAGIDGVNVGDVAKVVTMASDQLGTATITAGSGITVTPTANTITIAASGGGGGVDSLAGNTGGALTGALDIVTANSTVEIAGAGTTLTQDFAITNLVLGSSLPALTTGTGNVGLGSGVFTALTEGTNSVAIGTNALDASTTGANKIAIGADAMGSATSGAFDSVAIGNGALASATSLGIQSVAIGTSALGNCASGCVAVGHRALAGNGSGANKTAIGAGAGNKITSGGVDSVIIGALAMDDVTTTGNQCVAIGKEVLQASGAGTGCVGIGYHALRYSTVNNLIGIGSNALGNATSGGSNCLAIGLNTFRGLQSGGSNSIAIGNNALSVIVTTPYTAADNIAIGVGAGAAIISGGQNIMIGDGVLDILTTGSNNIAIGDNAGSSLSTSDSHNIMLNNAGTAGDNNTLRIGAATGTGTQELNKAFIHGIRGITTGVADAINVLVDSAGQLGTVSSSIRYKENVEDMGDVSSGLKDLRPVTFDYKDKPSHKKQVGLIAEEVEKVMPNLVVYNQDGEVETVKYHELPTLLLNELQKALKRIEVLEETVRDCKLGE